MLGPSPSIGRVSAAPDVGVRSERVSRALPAGVADAARPVLVEPFAAGLLVAADARGSGSGDSSGPTEGGATSPRQVKPAHRTSSIAEIRYRATTPDVRQPNTDGAASARWVIEADGTSSDGDRYRMTFDPTHLPECVQHPGRITPEKDLARVPPVTSAAALCARQLRIDAVVSIGLMLAPSQARGESRTLTAPDPTQIPGLQPHRPQFESCRCGRSHKARSDPHHVL